MAEYEYQGVDRAGKKVTGKLQAENEGQLRMALRGQGIRPLKIGKVSAMNMDLGAFLTGRGVSLSNQQLVLFTRQLQVLISSSVPLVQALEVLADQSIDRGAQTIFSALREKVAGGSYLWEALSTYPRVFPKIYVSLIRAGEASGTVDLMLKRLSRYLEDAERVRKAMKSAAMYPIAAFGVGIGVLLVMLIFVIPKFEAILASSGQQLPALTKMVVDFSHFFQRNALVVIGSVITSAVLLSKYVKSPEGKKVVDRIVFRAPVFGMLVQKACMARFCRTMQTLLSSGVNLLDAIDVCRGTVDNAVLEVAIGKIKFEIESGKTLGMVTSKLNEFPKMTVQMISVGESTGNLDKMLEKIADFYEEDVDAAVAGVSKLIEPIMIVGLGGMVAFILVAMYLPIFQQAGNF